MTLRVSAPAVLLLWMPPIASAQSGALGHYDLETKPKARTELPAELAEISGLAFTGDGRLFGHGDEQSVIWQIDVARGRLVKRFAIGRGGEPLRADFEDMQVVGDRVFLVTSVGQVVEGREGGNGQTMPVVWTSRGLKAGCEVEGMTWDQASQAMLLLCKQVKSRRWKNHVVVLAVSPGTGRFEPEPRLTLREEDLKRVTGAGQFAGSAIVRHPRTGTYLIVAGPQRLIAEADSTGRVLGGGPLSRALHRQPEGVAIGPDLTLYISDEAAGKTATVTGYAWRP